MIKTNDHRIHPKFTAPAAKLWAAIPDYGKKILLSNGWSTNCQNGVIMTNFTGTVKAGDLLLIGKCSVCNGDVARIIETV